MTTLKNPKEYDQKQGTHIKLPVELKERVIEHIKGKRTLASFTAEALDEKLKKEK